MPLHSNGVLIERNEGWYCLNQNWHADFNSLLRPYLLCFAMCFSLHSIFALRLYTVSTLFPHCFQSLRCLFTLCYYNVTLYGITLPSSCFHVILRVSLRCVRVCTPECICLFAHVFLQYFLQWLFSPFHSVLP